MARQLFINGRFVGGGATAVNAVARDLTRALAAIRSDRWNIGVAVPADQKEAAQALECPVRVIGRHSGIAWEQLDLPALRHEGVVAGLFNTVPLWGRGYVTMLHDAHVFSTPGSYGMATRLWRQTLSRRAGRPGNAVITVSQHSRDALLRHGIGNPERIGVVPNGLGPVGTLDPDPGVFETLNIDATLPYCVALSSLLPHKNIAVLLRAFADPGLAGVTLVLVGKAGATEFHAAGHEVPSSVRFAGFVSDAELAALYGNALAVCMPSTEEGFGLPALEGMALGAPALVSDCGALPEVVADAGLVLQAHDADAWVGAINKLRNEASLRADLARKGRARARAFTWTQAAQTFMDHLDRWYPPVPH